MGRMSLATRSRVVSLSKSGYPISKIQKHLEKEGTRVSKKSLCLLLKKGQPVRYKMKAKHPPKVNVWAGISSRGATNVVVFMGTFTATQYVDILEAALIPFLEEVYPDRHRFQQDNDPKHTSRYAKDYIEEKEVNRFKTPASSPNLNPIELMWHALKDYLRNDYKPKNLGDLKVGIKAFWETLTPAICKKIHKSSKEGNPKSYQSSEIAFRILVLFLYLYTCMH